MISPCLVVLFVIVSSVDFAFAPPGAGVITGLITMWPWWYSVGWMALDSREYRRYQKVCPEDLANYLHALYDIDGTAAGARCSGHGASTVVCANV